MSRKKPYLKSKRYCSPTCGRGCTRAEYNAAQRNAAALARSLGPKWKPRVWENLGWHYSAKLGRSSSRPPGSNCAPITGGGEVHYHGPRHYWADFHFGGKQFHANGATARSAVRNVMKQAKAVAYAALDAAERIKGAL